MGTIYRRVPLAVSALFMPDGTLYPRTVELDDSVFRIDKIVSRIKRSPRIIGIPDSIEYTVMVRGRKKKIYFDEKTNMWFSVKEITS